jgi:hypothetical protein
MPCKGQGGTLGALHFYIGQSFPLCAEEPGRKNRNLGKYSIHQGGYGATVAVACQYLLLNKFAMSVPPLSLLVSLLA